MVVKLKAKERNWNSQLTPKKKSEIEMFVFSEKTKDWKLMLSRTEQNKNKFWQNKEEDFCLLFFCVYLEEENHLLETFQFCFWCWTIS